MWKRNYSKFKQEYLDTYKIHRQLSEPFLDGLHRVIEPLNKYVIERSGGEYDVELDVNMANQISVHIDIYKKTQPTIENVEILLAQFFVDRKAEYDAFLFRYWNRKYFLCSRAWEKSMPLPLNTREDENDGHDSYVKLKFSEVNPYWQDYLKYIGVGIGRKSLSGF